MAHEFPEPKLHVPMFRRAAIQVLSMDPVTPHLEVKWEADIENKAGWTKLEAIKDAFRDGFKAGAKAFIETTGAELEEWLDWNPEEPIYTVRIPIPGLRWISYTIRVKHISGWLKRKLHGS